MAKWLVMMLCALGIALPSAAQAQQKECACLHNRANRDVPYRFWYKDENGIVRKGRLDANRQTSLCWSEGLFGSSRSQVFVEIDSALVAPAAKGTFELLIADAPSGSCSSTPSSSHYAFRPDPGNPIYLTVTMDTGNNAPATPAPAYPSAYPQPAYPQPAYPQSAYPPPPAYVPPPPAYPAPPPVYPAPTPVYPAPPPSYPAPPPAYPPAPPPGGFLPPPATGTPGATRPPLF
jgi:hypothetical protein